MQDLQPMAKMMIAAGLLLTGVGLFLLFAGKVPGLGKLPGDIVVQKKNFSLYFPLTTSLALSAGLSLILWLIRKR